MNKLLETIALTFLAIALVRGFHLVTGQKMEKVTEHLTNVEERELYKLITAYM